MKLENIVDLIKAIDESEMDRDVKAFIKGAAHLHVEGKGQSAQDELLESVSGGAE